MECTKTLLIVGIAQLLVVIIYVYGIKFVQDETPEPSGKLLNHSSVSPNYALAFSESNGFFTNIEDTDWIWMKQRQRQTKDCLSKCGDTPAESWYQNNFEPTFSCQHERQIGGLGDGGKWVCDPFRIPKETCLVYSVGSKNKFNFEEGVLQHISGNCEIHTFDPTSGDSPSTRPSVVKFHPWGVGNKTEVNEKGWHMKTVADIIQLLGHQNRTIDIFKMDCEGCEWDTYKDWNNNSNIRQVLLEMHGIKQSRQLLTSMKAHHWAVFHKEPNTKGCGGRCIEYAFIHLNKQFFT